MVLNIKALCVSTPCLLEDWLILKIRTVRSFAAPVTAYQLKRHVISEDFNVYCKFFSGFLLIFIQTSSKISLKFLIFIMALSVTINEKTLKVCFSLRRQCVYFFKN